jgi:hypothetical protein
MEGRESGRREEREMTFLFIKILGWESTVIEEIM